MADPGALLPDVSVLLALVVPADPRRGAALDALESATRWVTTPFTECGLVRLAMNVSVPGAGLSAAEALAALRGLRSHPAWAFLTDDAPLGESQVDLGPLVGHRQLVDFHLVDLAARHGLTLVTFDGRLPASLSAPDRCLVRLLTP